MCARGIQEKKRTKKGGSLSRWVRSAGILDCQCILGFGLSPFMKWALGSLWWGWTFVSQAQRTPLSLLLPQPASLNLISEREADLLSEPAECLAALLSLEGAAWDGYGLSNGRLPRLAKTSIPQCDHKRAIKTAITAYYWLGPSWSCGDARGMPRGCCQPPRSGSRWLCGLRCRCRAARPCQLHPRPALPHNTSQSRIWPEKWLLEYPPFLPVLSTQRSSVRH